MKEQDGQKQRDLRKRGPIGTQTLLLRPEFDPWEVRRHTRPALGSSESSEAVLRISASFENRRATGRLTSAGKRQDQICGFAQIAPERKGREEEAHQRPFHNLVTTGA